MRLSPFARRTARITIAAGLLIVLSTTLLATVAAHWRRPPSAAAARLLIVHSYGTDLPWVSDVDLGINAVLKGSGIAVRRHHMNLLNHPDCSYLRVAAQEAQEAIDDWQPQALVLVDDLAQALVGVSHLRTPSDAASAGPLDAIDQLTAGRCEGLRPPVPSFVVEAVFYAGVNGRVADYGYDRAANVTGVLEHKNLPALAALFKQVNDAAQLPAVAVQLLNDRSSAALAEGDQHVGEHWSPLRWLEPASAGTFAEWQQHVLAASRRGAMLLIANYQNLRDDEGRIVPADAVVAWTERHSVYPAVGAATSFVSDGGLVTAAMSGVEQGDAVARMALHYLRSGELLPAQSAHRLLIGLNRTLVRKRHLEAVPLYRRLRADPALAKDVSEHVYLENEMQGAKP